MTVAVLLLSVIIIALGINALLTNRHVDVQQKLIEDLYEKVIVLHEQIWDQRIDHTTPKDQYWYSDNPVPGPIPVTTVTISKPRLP